MFPMEVCFDMYRNQYNTAQIDLGFLCCYLCLFFFFNKVQKETWNQLLEQYFQDQAKC